VLRSKYLKIGTLNKIVFNKDKIHVSNGKKLQHNFIQQNELFKIE